MGKPIHNQGGVWADETIVARLKELWAQGNSCSQIAFALGNGITRNAVIGKVTRLGLPDRGGATGGNSRKGYVRTKPVIAKPRLIVIKGDVAAPFFLCPLETFAEGDTCRFISGDIGRPGWQMCGHPGHPWCEYHRTVVFDTQKTQASQKAAEKAQQKYAEKHVSMSWAVPVSRLMGGRA